MAKVRVRNLKSVFYAVEKIFEDSIKSQQFLNEIKDFAVLRIQAETRKGRDLKNDREQPPLSEKYIEWRKNLVGARKRKIGKGLTMPSNKNKPRPDPNFFKPDKSNLTLTGQLLSSLTGGVKKSKNEIEVYVTGRRSDGETNSFVVKDLASRGRFFLWLDSKGIQLIRKKTLDLIRRTIRRKGFTKK